MQQFNICGQTILELQNPSFEPRDKIQRSHGFEAVKL